MTRSLQHAPFVAFSNPRLCDVIQLGDSSEWDRFGSSTKGELYWNSQVAGFGLICGPYPLQTSTITRRLMSSHLRHQGARILVLHTDHFSVRRSPCPLLFSAWPRVKVLTSPLTVDGPSKVLMPTDGSTSCISFQSSSVTLRHILSFFTLPVGGQEHTSVDHGIQLILSQMHEPFDLQRFSDLIDQETWSEERASFLALRLELLRKLFSSDAQYRRPERVTVIDMTSQLLHSTGLDGTILDMALYSFIHESDSPKMIVLSNCEQYLTHSSLNATVEALASSGSSRPASIILTTTNPTSISLPIINTLDYIMTYSHTWNNFFYDHFRIRISKGQTHVAIWAPESQICTSESLDPELRLYFGDELVYTNMDELEKSIPLDCPTEEIPVESPAINEEGILERISEQNMAIHSEESINEEEPGIIPIDGVQLEDPGEPSGIYQSATAQPVTEVSSSIRGEEGESEDPLVVVPLTKETSQTLSATQSPSLPDTLTSRRHLAPQKRCDIKDFPFSHRAVVSAMVKLTSGMTNLKVPLSGLKHSLKSEFRGAREEFLFSLITKAREEGVLMLKLEEDLVWLVDPRATKASGEDAINDNSGLIEACPLDEYPAAYQNLVITLWKMTNGSYLLRKDMGTVINSLLAEFSANYQDAGTATSLIFEAREANVVHCGKSGNMWWTSLLPPTTGIDADRRTLTDNPDAQWSLFPGPHLSPIDRPDSRSPDLIKGPAADSYANTMDSSTPAAGGTLAAPNVLSEPSDEHHKLNSTPISTEQSSLKAEIASIPSVPGTPTAVLSQGLDFHRFESITSITKTLIRDSRRAPVEYKEMALVGGKMHSVKLLVPTEKPATPAVKTPEPEPEHFALEQTTLGLPGFTEQQKAQMAYLTPRLRNEYPNLDDEALMSLVVSCMFDEEEDNEQWVERVNEPRQPLPISPYSLSSDIKLESSDADIAPDVLLITHKKLLATINQLVDGTSESQVPMSDVLLSLQAQYPDADMDVLFSFVVQAEEERVIGISDYPLKHKPVVAALLKVTEGKLETKVRRSLVEHALQLEYPRAKHEFLLSLILEAEKGGVLMGEISRADIAWVSLLPPGSHEVAAASTSQLSSELQPNSLQESSSPTPHDTNSPPPNTSSPSSLPSGFRATSPRVNIVSSPEPSPVTQNERLSVQDYPPEHHAVVSVLVTLTYGYRGVKVRMSDVTKELQLTHRGETQSALFSLITRAEADKVLSRERDVTGLFWVFLRDPLPSPSLQTAPTSHSAPQLTLLSQPEGSTNMSLGTPVSSNNGLTSPVPSNESLSQLTPASPNPPDSKAISSPTTKNAKSPNKSEPLISAVSHLSDGEIGILVDLEAARKQVGQREEITQDMEQHKVVCETDSTSHRGKASSEELTGPGNAHSVAVPPPLPNEEEGMMALGSATLESRNMVSLESPVILTNPPVNQKFIVELTPPSITPLTTAISNQPSVGSSNHDPYQPLISAILNVSENRPNVWVSFEAVKKMMGNVNELDWETYTSTVKEAATKSVILLSERDSGEKFIKLLPEIESASGANTALIIKECPEEFRLLVATVLKLGSNDVGAKIPFVAVGNIVGKTKADIQALGYGWVSYPQWVQKAHESGWIQQGGFTEERWLMVGPKKTFFSGSTGNFTDLAAKRNPLSVTKDLTGQSRTVMEPSQMLESLTPNAGNSKDQALSQEVNAPVPSASSSATVLPQSEQSSTIGASEPSEHPLVSSSATSVDHAAIVSRSKHVDSKGPTFGTNNSSSTSFMFSGSSLTRRVSIDAYAPRHRRIVETMLTLCGGKTHIGVTRRELFATLQGNTSVGAIRQTLPKLISKAMEEGVLEGFMDDQKEICFFLRNPVLMSTKKTSSTTWFPSMEFRR